MKKIDAPLDGVALFAGGIGEGASIRTPCGPRRVEMVRAGDLIVTRDNGLQPVRLVWKRKVTMADLSLHGEMAPVRMMQRALGPMMPQRPLLLAPDQRVLVPGYRLAVEDGSRSYLVNAADIAGSSDGAYVDRSLVSLTFYTFVFDAHQILACNGLPVESFLPSKASLSSLDGSFRDALIQRFPLLKRSPNAYPSLGYAFVAGADCLGA